MQRHYAALWAVKLIASVTLFVTPWLFPEKREAAQPDILQSGCF